MLVLRHYKFETLLKCKLKRVGGRSIECAEECISVGDAFIEELYEHWLDLLR